MEKDDEDVYDAFIRVLQQATKEAREHSRRLQAERARLIKQGYNPDEPRDWHGRWEGGGFDVDGAISSLKAHLSSKPFGEKNCAGNVANSIRSTGIPVDAPSSKEAKDYGLPLEAAGFEPVADDSSGAYPPIGYLAQKGDVVVMQAVAGHKAGHMAMYDGQQWISDFKQSSIWPSQIYRINQSEYIIYRHRSLME